MPLSEFPAVPPDPSVRDVEDDSWWGKSKEKKKDFYESGSIDICMARFFYVNAKCTVHIQWNLSKQDTFSHPKYHSCNL